MSPVSATQQQHLLAPLYYLIPASNIIWYQMLTIIDQFVTIFVIVFLCLLPL